MMKRPYGMANGGMVQSPQQQAAERQDNVPIRVSGGEVVLSADEVRVIGLDKLNKMRQKARETMLQMKQEGQVKGGAYADGGYVVPRPNAFGFDPVVYARMIDRIKKAEPLDLHVVAPEANKRPANTSLADMPSLVDQIFGPRQESTQPLGGGANAGGVASDTGSVEANSLADVGKGLAFGLSALTGPFAIGTELMSMQAQHDLDNEIDSPAAQVGRSLGMTPNPQSFAVTNEINRSLDMVDYDKPTEVSPEDFSKTETDSETESNTDNSTDSNTGSNNSSDNSSDNSSNSGDTGSGDSGDSGDYARGGFVSPRIVAKQRRAKAMKYKRKGFLAR